MAACARTFCLLCATLTLAACAPMLSLIGTNQTIVQTVAQVERVKVAGDGASYVASSKTITDHALSVAMDKDCKVLNVFTRDPVCTPKPADTKVSVAPRAATASSPQSAMQVPHDKDMENSAPVPVTPEGGEL